MPSPVGHALGGLIVGFGLTSRATPGSPAFGSPAQLAWLAAVACLPDLDFLWGRHNMETHSLPVAAGAGVVAALAFRSARLGVAVGLSMASHVAFDWLGSDDAPPIGVMALWPVSDAFYFADAYVFDAISRQTEEPGFLRHNLLAVAREVALLAPVAAVVRWLAGPRPAPPRP